MSSTSTVSAMPDLAVVNCGQQARLLVIEGDTIRRQIQTGFARIERHAWNADGRFAVLSRRARHGWREARLLRSDGERLDTTGRLEVPILCSDLAWFDGRLIVCGHSDAQPRAWSIDPGAAGAGWQPLAMPDGRLWARKAFDALVSRGERLVALDNIVFPKWMVHYRADPSGVPQLLDVTPLHENGPYEHVISAHAGESRFAVLSSTVGRSGFHLHITLYRWQDHAASAVLTLPAGCWQYAMQGDDLWVMGAPTATDTGTPATGLYRYRPGGTGEVIDLTALAANGGASDVQLTRSRMGVLYLVNGECTQVIQPERLALGHVPPF
jgi:hypothetical protein